MKVRLSQDQVELIPENGFERDALHHVRFHGVKSTSLCDPRGASVLGLTLNPERLQEVGFNEAVRRNNESSVAPVIHPPADAAMRRESPEYGEVN